MEITFKTITLFATVILTGLSAGFFYAWEVTVIPGTKLIADRVYLETMQSINRAILNPAFFIIFMGSLVLLIISTIQQYGKGMAFWIMLLALLTYLGGTFLVTGMGNVPLNNELDVLQLDTLSPERIQEFRQYYESRWNVLHTIRTVFSVISFILLLINFKLN